MRFAFKNGEGVKVEHHLRFGDETALGVFASMADDGPVFVLSRSVRDTCQLSLINRTLFPTSSDAFSAITLEAHEEKYASDLLSTGRALNLTWSPAQATVIPA